MDHIIKVVLDVTLNYIYSGRKENQMIFMVVGFSSDVNGYVSYSGHCR